MIVVRGVSVLVPIVAGVGLVFVWSAIHGAQVSATLRDLLAGRHAQAPADDPLLLGRNLPASTVGGQAGSASQVGGAAVGGQAGNALQSAFAALNGGGA